MNNFDRIARGMAGPVVKSRITRREMVASVAALGVGAFAGFPRLVAGAPARISSLHVISRQPDLFCGWPTLARRKNGQLLLVWSGGREGHVCPFGRVEMMTSGDGGETWSWPRVLLDGPIDDRDSGVVETAQGTLLVTTFTSLAFEPVLERAEGFPDGAPNAWPAARLASWRSARGRLNAEERKQELGTWMIRSTDGGVTWSARYDCLVNSPHGPVQLSDGRLLYAGKQLWRTPGRVGVCESSDDGQSWRWLAEIPTRTGDRATDYHELHAVESSSGKIVVQIRNHNQANERETLQCESDDGGRTWTVPHSIGVWGFPSHLLRLRDGRLLMSYGHRRAPRGNLARVSGDHGSTWSEPVTISDDATSDMGYPSTVQLDDGSLVTVWYEVMKGSPRAVLRQARWTLEG